MSKGTSKFLDAVAATGPGPVITTDFLQAPYTVQVSGKTTAGSGSAVVDIEVSNDNITFIVAGTVTLTLGTTATADGFAMNANWRFVRGNVKTLTGTGATVDAVLGG